LIDGVTQGEAVSYSFYVVGGVSILVAIFVSVGLRNLKGEEGKGWKTLLTFRGRQDGDSMVEEGQDSSTRQVSEAVATIKSRIVSDKRQKLVPYLNLLKDSVLLGFTDSRITLGYLGGFVARASTVAISLFIPLYINTFYISNGFCQGSPHDPSPELKKECRAAYVLSSILTGVAQLMGLICAPLFGYLSSRTGRVNYPVVVGAVFGIVGYIIFPQLSSPEVKDVDGRGGTPAIFLVVSLIGISQIAAIVCSLGSLGRGVLAVEGPRTLPREPTIAPTLEESTEREPLLRVSTDLEEVSRVRLKGSIAGVYSLWGGAAILLLTKLGGYLFDKYHAAPFYLMASFNAILLVASLLIDAAHAFTRAD
jgi:MFS family permease